MMKPKFKHLLGVLLSLSLMLICMTVMPTRVSAAATTASGSCSSGVYWRISDDGTLTVYGTGAIPYYDYNCSITPPWYQYEDSITSIVVQNGITAIGEDAFCGMPNVTSVSLPNSLTTIGETAFHSCSKLTEVTIPDSVTTLDLCVFQYCDNLKSVTLGSGITEIPYATFRSCKSLTNVVIPNSVTKIDSSAFESCTALESIVIPDSVVEMTNNPFSNCKKLKSIVVGDNNTAYTVDSQGAVYQLYQGKKNELVVLPGSFQGKYVIPDGVSNIGGYACEGCVGLTEISIPDSVTFIWVDAFNGCTALTSVDLPDKLSKINDSTFKDCYNLESIEIPETVSAVGEYAFSGCYKLKSLRFGSISSIGKNAFQGMTAEIFYPTNDNSWTDSLKQSYGGNAITYTPYSVGEWTWTLDSAGTLTITGTGAMNAYSISEAVPWYSQKDAIQKVVIGDGITKIGARAFYKCSNLKEISVPDSVTAIEQYAFYYCEALTAIEIPAAVTELGRYAFYYCTSLMSIELSDAITKIEDSAFYGCSELAAVKFPASLISIGSGAFMSCKKLTSVVLPDGVTYIGGAAFSSCTALSELKLSKNLEIIDGMQAFYGCDGLAEIELPDSLKSIGDSAFYSCDGLTNIRIPAGVSDIGTSAFAYCKKLTAFVVDEDNPYYFSDSSGVLYTKDLKLLHSCPTAFQGDYRILEGVQEIGSHAFRYCKELTSVNIPNSVQKVGYYAFGNCEKLEQVVLPDSVTVLGYSAFYDCSRLQYVTLGRISTIENGTFQYCALRGVVIPDSVTTIGGYAFRSCGLVNIVIPSGVTQINSYAFDGNTNLAHVLYKGTSSQKARMTIGTDGNTYLKNASWCYNANGKITERSDCTKQYFDCSVCGKTYSREKSYDSHIWVEATCVMPKYCTVCETTSGDALGHSFTEATCTTAKTCTVCGDIEGEPLGHSGEIWIELITPTCTADGLKARICEVCGATETVSIKAPGHQGETVVTAPTCTEQGYSTVSCTVCGMTAKVDYVPALGHNAEIVVTAPTCTEQGYTTSTCTVCGEVTVTDYVDAKGHKWSAWIQTKAPTCTTEGSELRFCNCGTRETQAIAKSAHTCENGICTVCGALESYNWVLSANADVNLSLAQDLYVDLSGFALTGTITTNGYQIYGTDSTTNRYTCDNMGYFACTDASGKAIIPVKTHQAADLKRYMSIETENGYTFHRFYMGITNVTLAPNVTGLGYKAEIIGDEMVQTQIAAVGYELWVNESHVVSRSKTGFHSSITLLLTDFDVKKQGETPVNACVTVKLSDGTVLKGAVHSNSMRQVVEALNTQYTRLSQEQLTAVQTMITNIPAMQTWTVDKLYKKP